MQPRFPRLPVRGGNLHIMIIIHAESDAAVKGELCLGEFVGEPEASSVL